METLSDPSLMDILTAAYGLDVIAIARLPLGADMNAAVYKSETRENHSYFVKLKRGHHQDISTTIMELLQQAQVQQIIPPLKTTNGQTTHLLDGFTLIVYPFVEGQDGFTHPLTDDQWILLGKTMRQIHEIDVPLSMQRQIRKESYSPHWRDSLRSLCTRIKDEQIRGDIAGELLAFIKNNWATIHRLVDRAEALAQQLHDKPLAFVLCHSDIHGGNIFIDEINHLYIVDWDEPIMAPKERDLMFIGGGVGNIWNKPHEEALFYQGYGPAEVNQTALAYYRHERIVEDMAIYIQDVLFTTTKSDENQEMVQHFTGMFAPRGVVEIAFETDKG